MAADIKLAERLADAWIARETAESREGGITQSEHTQLSYTVNALAEGTDPHTLRYAQFLVRQRMPQADNDGAEVKTDAVAVEAATAQIG